MYKKSHHKCYALIISISQNCLWPVWNRFLFNRIYCEYECPSSKLPLFDKIVAPDNHNLKTVNILKANWEWSFLPWSLSCTLKAQRELNYIQWLWWDWQRNRWNETHTYTTTATQTHRRIIKGNNPEMSVPMGNLPVSVTAPHHH